MEITKLSTWLSTAEEQLNNCYRHYCLHQVRKDFSFMKLEDFRAMFEDIMVEVYNEEEQV